ncbi:DEAD/DEAH box helicase [Luteolibacter flavescens]|uniref:DEAD/DEAH box helicase n=1 Tax=Luteolibacter flavescens TaxID=1859460 RepID=A0ABT3FTY0_9BACT|nr:DEAD/DEAH box helicase [Luteolibacter flavescens]MCW1887045.1 DEAD/DEAH box helicase [Luteolibacter flavescens]
METPPFSELGLPSELLAAVESLGFERPSPIQAKAIPVALTGRDILGLSHTGSGKTAAFTLPLLAKLDFKKRLPQALILCPTRELAVQVCEEVHRLGSKLGQLRAVPVYGGAPMDRQLRALRDGVQVVVGTPGRVMDHLRRGSFDVSEIQTIVLDEADRMLDLGFREEMEELLGSLPKERQSMFFSATMSKGVSHLIGKFGNNPETVQIDQKAKTVSTIDQSYFEVRERSKVEVLSRLLDMEQARLAIIFCNTKRSVDECTESLLARGYTVDRLHGDITQQMRERVLRRFREGTIELLVATDVAARGLDVENIDVVFNYDLPQDPEDYVHRIGRTGRAGRSGRAVSFVFGREIHRLEMIERYTRQVIRREKVPSQEQVEGRLADLAFEEIKERLEKSEFQSHEEQVDRLLEQGYTPTDIASVLFTLLREARGREFGEIQEDREDPRDRRQQQRGDRREPREFREREPRAPRERRDGPHDNADMVPLFFSLGKFHGVKVGEIIGMLYGEAGLPDGAVGHVKLFAKHSSIDVRADCAERLVQISKGAQLRGRNFILDFDRGPRGPRGA